MPLRSSTRTVFVKVAAFGLTASLGLATLYLAQRSNSETAHREQLVIQDALSQLGDANQRLSTEMARIDSARVQRLYHLQVGDALHWPADAFEEYADAARDDSSTFVASLPADAYPMLQDCVRARAAALGAEGRYWSRCLTGCDAEVARQVEIALEADGRAVAEWRVREGHKREELASQLQERKQSARDHALYATLALCAAIFTAVLAVVLSILLLRDSVREERAALQFPRTALRETSPQRLVQVRSSSGIPASELVRRLGQDKAERAQE